MTDTLETTAPVETPVTPVQGQSLTCVSTRIFVENGEEYVEATYSDGMVIKAQL